MRIALIASRPETPMTDHTLTLCYDGRRAAHGALLPSASKQVIAGAQALLSAHGYYFTQAMVPDRLLDRSDYFEINDLARSDGDTWRADFRIDVASDEYSDTKKFGFGAFFAASYRAWLEKKLCGDPPYDRRQPILAYPAHHANIAASDDSVPSMTHRRRLYAKLSDAMALITAPIGASSTSLELFWDGKLLDTRASRHYSDADIEDALVAIKLRTPPKVQAANAP